MKVCDTCRFVFVFPEPDKHREWAKEKDLRAVNVFISASCELSIIGSREERVDSWRLRFKLSISYINCDVNLSALQPSLFYLCISQCSKIRKNCKKFVKSLCIEKNFKKTFDFSLEANCTFLCRFFLGG